MSFDHLKSLRAEYDRLAEAVQGTEPNSVARTKAMDEKKKAFAKWNDARLAQEKVQAVAPVVAFPPGMAVRSATTPPMAAVPAFSPGKPGDGKPGAPSTASPAKPDPGK